MIRRVFPLLALVAATLLAQKAWREYPAFEYNNFPTPPDFAEKTEFAFGRLMYPNAAGGFGGRGRGFGRRGFGSSDWRQGGRGIFWTMDYPRSDRHLMLAVRRLTRVHARSVEEPINLEDGEEYNWPWLYGVEVGHWDLGDDLSKKLREYLLRGGFLMVDDFHGSYEWDVFMQSMQKVFPDRPVVDLDDKDPIFHSIYDLDDRIQVPGASPWFGRGVTYEQDGVRATWRGIYDDHNRLMVAICHNMDLGDSWEHADNPQYPEKFSALGIRIATNYIVYAMTH
jgi:Domain of unknown function (DUF4159)